MKDEQTPPAGLGAWLPIATAPEGRLVVVGWLESEDDEHPERHDFDWLEDGCWSKWHDYAEHVEVIGGHGVGYTPPYTHWLNLPAIPGAPNVPLSRRPRRRINRSGQQ